MAHFITLPFAELLQHCGGSLDEAQRLTGFSRDVCERYAAGEEPSAYHAMLLGLIGKELLRGGSPSA